MWKATISLVMSVCLSVHIEQLAFHWTYFHAIWYSNFFRKLAEKFQVYLKYNKNNAYFIWRRTYVRVHLWQYLAQFLEWKMFQAEVVKKIKRDTWCSTIFLPQILPLWDNLEKIW